MLLHRVGEEAFLEAPEATLHRPEVALGLVCSHLRLQVGLVQDEFAPMHTRAGPMGARGGVLAALRKITLLDEFPAAPGAWHRTQEALLLEVVLQNLEGHELATAVGAWDPPVRTLWDVSLQVAGANAHTALVRARHHALGAEAFNVVCQLVGL